MESVADVGGHQPDSRNVFRTKQPAVLRASLPGAAADPSRHDLNGVVARALLDRFLEYPSPWSECAWLNRWDARADDTFRDHLDSRAARLRASGLEGRTPAMVQETFGL